MQLGPSHCKGGEPVRRRTRNRPPLRLEGWTTVFKGSGEETRNGGGTLGVGECQKVGVQLRRRGAGRWNPAAGQTGAPRS